MATRAMNAMAGFDWLTRGINLGRSNPKAIFGGAALLLLTMVGIALAMSLVVGIVVAVASDSMAAMLVIMVVLMAAMLTVLAMLLVGFLRLIHAVESNQPARATDVFSGFGDMPTSLRAIGFLLLLGLIQNVLMVGTLAVLAADVLGWYGNAMQASMALSAPGSAAAPAVPAGLPDGFGLAMLVMLVIGLFTMGVQAIGLSQIALRGAGVGKAMSDGVAGAFKNLLPLLVQMVAIIVASLVASIVLVIVMLIVGLLAKLVGTWLMVLIGIPLYVGFVLAMYVVIFGMQYHCWRDVCSGDDAAQAPADALTA